MSLRGSLLAGHYYAFLSRRLMPAVDRLGISANQLTLLGLVFALLVPPAFRLGLWYAFSAMLLSAVADTLDGLASRSRGGGSGYGAFLDSTVDRASDFLYLLGFWQLFLHSPHLPVASLLIFLSFFVTLLISYVKARAESLGCDCGGEFMGRAMRTIYLLVWTAVLALFRQEELLWGGLMLYLLLCCISLAMRLQVIRSGLRQRDRDGA